MIEQLNEEQDFDNPDVNDQFADENQGFKVYQYRHYISIMYIMSSLAVSFQQNTFAPEAASLAIIYNLDPIWVNMTSLIHMILYTPVSFISIYILQKYGMKVGMWFVVVFCAGGSWLRVLVNHGWAWVLMGQFCVGIGNPFCLNMMNKVSATWYYPRDRPVVTTVLNFFSSLTGLIGLMMPGIWFLGYDCSKDSQTPCTQKQLDQGKDLTFTLCFWQAILITFLCIPPGLFFKNQPPTPPSFSTEIAREPYAKALKILFQQQNYILMMIGFSFYYGAFTLFAVELSFILQPYGFGSAATSYLAMSPIFSGIIGAVIAGRYVKKTRRYRFTILICQVGTIVGFVLFTAVLPTQSMPLYMICCLLIGLFMVPLIPIMLELACEISFPVSQEGASGYLFASDHISAFILGIILSFVAKGENESQSYGACVIMISVFAMGLIATFFVQEDLLRIKAETTRQAIILDEDGKEVSAVGEQLEDGDQFGNDSQSDISAGK